MKHMDGMNQGNGITADELRDSHPRLDLSAKLEHQAVPNDDT